MKVVANQFIGLCKLKLMIRRGTLGGIRTPDARLRTAALYPLSYQGVDNYYTSIRLIHSNTRHLL